MIGRPDEQLAGTLPNEDAQSLVFDDPSLFDWDKFSGYDRVGRGGTRVNIGLRYRAELGASRPFPASSASPPARGHQQPSPSRT